MSFGRLERATPGAPLSEINMTPLIDVMLVLLVIFMITAPLMVSAVKVDLPQAEGTQAAAVPQSLAVSLDAQGQIYLDDQPIANTAFSVALAEAAKRSPLTEVQLRADTTVPYGRVLEVMGLAHQAGLTRIGFVAQPQSSPASP
jgi:biopolymer transport protein TolR